MKKSFLLLFCFCFAQDNYSGTVNFNYNGTVNNNFTSLVQDTLESGIAFNQIAQDTSYFVFGSVTQQDENQFDLFLVFLETQYSQYNLELGISQVAGMRTTHSA